MKQYLNQLESKNAEAGEVLFDKVLTDNVLLFVATGALMICSKKNKETIEVKEGHFILLPAETEHIATAVTTARIQVIHAGPLSDMIINDPEWNPERPVVLPILPALAHTLSQIEYYQNESHFTLN